MLIKLKIKLHSNKTIYFFALLRPEAMKLFGSNEQKIAKDKNGKNVPQSEITEPGLVHCNLVSKTFQNCSRVSHTFIPK